MVKGAHHEQRMMFRASLFRWRVIGVSAFATSCVLCMQVPVTESGSRVAGCGFIDQEKYRPVDEFRDIIGSIVLVAEPMSTSSLARLLDIPRAAIDRRLHSLHSVLRVLPEEVTLLL